MRRIGSAWLAGAVLAAGMAFLPGLAAADGPEISGNLGAHPYQYNGRAPHKFLFKGVIKVQGVKKGSPVTVAYMYNFSDGSTQNGGQFTFARNGVRQIHTSWTFGAPGESGDGWCELKLTQPFEQSVCKANFSYKFKMAK